MRIAFSMQELRERRSFSCSIVLSFHKIRKQDIAHPHPRRFRNWVGRRKKADSKSRTDVEDNTQESEDSKQEPSGPMVKGLTSESRDGPPSAKKRGLEVVKEPALHGSKLEIPEDEDNSLPSDVETDYKGQSETAIIKENEERNTDISEKNSGFSVDEWI
jgi:hypothetical protein